MIRTRFKKVLLVGPDALAEQLLTDCRNVKQIESLTSVFPSLYEFNPDMVIFDYDHFGKDVEKTLRRITANQFYSKLKIACYKKSSHTKIDALLTALGVDFFVYQDDLDLMRAKKGKTLMGNFNAILDASILKWAGNVTSGSL